jgi:hypothetical protein
VKSRRPSKAKTAHAAAADVDALLEQLVHPGKPIIKALRRVILAADGRIREGVKWNAPSFYTTEHFATFHLRTQEGVQLILHLGATPRPDAALQDALAESSVPLAWKSPDRAIVTFRDLAQVRREQAAFTRLIRQWIEHVD